MNFRFASRPARLCFGLIAAALFICAAACTSESASSSTTSASPTASPPATPTPHPTPPPTGRSYSITAPTPVQRDGWTLRPLAAIAPNANAYAKDYRGSSLGIAVAVPSEHTIYTLNGDEPFEVLSVAKVPIMLTFLEGAARTDHAITDDEYDLLERMITQSDNSAADAIWTLAGGAKAVDAMLTAAGIDGPKIDRDSWGESLFTPEQTAALLAALIDGETFHPETRDIALDLMESVVSWQAWGVGSGVPDDATYGVKNGWYLEKEGWVLNSTGFVIPDDDPTYTVAIFSMGMKDFLTGTSEVEAIARRIHSDVYLGR